MRDSGQQRTQLRLPQRRELFLRRFLGLGVPGAACATARLPRGQPPTRSRKCPVRCTGGRGVRAGLWRNAGRGGFPRGHPPPPHSLSGREDGRRVGEPHQHDAAQRPPLQRSFAVLVPPLIIVGTGTSKNRPRRGAERPPSASPERPGVNAARYSGRRARRSRRATQRQGREEDDHPCYQAFHLVGADSGPSVLGIVRPGAATVISQWSPAGD